MALWWGQIEGGQCDITRQKFLHACLISSKAWLGLLGTFSSREYLAFPFSLAALSARSIGMLIHLSTLDELGWDKEYAKSQVDLVGTMDGLIKSLESGITTLQGTSTEENIYTRHCNFFKSIQSKVASKLNAQDIERHNFKDTGFGTAEFAFPEDMFSWSAVFGNEMFLSPSSLANGQQQVL